MVGVSVTASSGCAGTATCFVFVTIILMIIAISTNVWLSTSEVRRRGAHQRIPCEGPAGENGACLRVDGFARVPRVLTDSLSSLLTRRRRRDADNDRLAEQRGPLEAVLHR